MTREKQIELMKNAPARIDAVFERYKKARLKDRDVSAQDLIEEARKARELDERQEA
jgi:hypothetical protein